MEVNTTLAQRQATHGSFAENAATSQALCNVMRAGVSWRTLTDTQREALEMVVHKIARIVNGNPNFADHWHDICGYAKLAEQLCPDYKVTE